jgi:hypothetical protein
LLREFNCYFPAAGHRGETHCRFSFHVSSL